MDILQKLLYFFSKDELVVAKDIIYGWAAYIKDF